MKRLPLAIAMLGAAACSPSEPAAEPVVDNTAPIAATAPGNDAAPALVAAPNASISQFTTNGLDKCKLVEKNEEEGGYARHLCPGAGGYSYEHVESDLRQNLVIIAPGGRRSELALNRVGGGGFSTLGATFDWRGPVGKPPTTVTVRYNVDDDGDSKTADRSHLLVIRLAAPACVIGTVAPGPRQSDRARAIADRSPLPGCAQG